MSQTQLHKASGVSLSYISTLESGSRGKRISFKKLKALADALGMSVEELEEWEPPGKSVFHVVYDLLSPDQKRKVDEFIKRLWESDDNSDLFKTKSAIDGKPKNK